MVDLPMLTIVRFIEMQVVTIAMKYYDLSTGGPAEEISLL